MSEAEIIVGIDLGTTNSEVAAYIGDRVEVIGAGGAQMLPSCVALSPGGTLLVGEAARNQQLLYPELTIRSIKRMMGSSEKVTLGDQSFTPQEISAFILRELAEWAARRLGQPVTKAVITVPAYFSDAQRQATREAGALAGLEVMRILNEPTAASLAYGHNDAQRRTMLIYDLGGGTFDVSIVAMEGDVTEVLASHGNNQLGGDDFDQLLLDHLLLEFQNKHGIDLRLGHRVAYSRLWWAAEEAKKKLSTEPAVRLREEALIIHEGKPLHLDLEIERRDFEEMIRPLVESTLDSVTKALKDASLIPGQLDGILLVGGATRTPMIARVLEERTGLAPRQEVHPDLCVALGAGVLASRLSGHNIERVLVDVSPYSFGVSHLGVLNGRPHLHCYKPLIRRNTPLPVTRTESYFTVYPSQKMVQVDVFQGDDPDALKNIPIGEFLMEGLTPADDENEIFCRMNLDIDGILNVTAIEKRTGKSAQITIQHAFAPKSEEELAGMRERLKEMYATRDQELEALFGAQDSEWSDTENGEEDVSDAMGIDVDEEAEPDAGVEVLEVEDPAWVECAREARELIGRSRGMLEKMHEDDREEAIDLHDIVEQALQEQAPEELKTALGQLRELLFFVEGK